MRRALRRLAVLPIRAYQRCVSPWKPPTCRFHPTCSHYAVEAVEVHGVLKGVLLGTWRVLRCQPFSEPGPDPVPPPGRWRPPAPGAERAGAEPGGTETDS